MHAAATPTAAADHGRRREAIAEALLADIFDGRLQAGQHLVTQELAERYGVSHTPIREALIQVSAMGLVDVVPNRGATVRSVSPRDVRDVCQVRRALECEAVRSACGRIDLKELSELAAGFRKLLDAPARGAARLMARGRDLDTRLHDVIRLSCGNLFLAQELARLAMLFRAFRDLSYRHVSARDDYRRVSVEAREHLAIVEALLAGESQAAARAMSEHIRSGMKYWSRALPELPAARDVSPARPTTARRRTGSSLP